MFEDLGRTVRELREQPYPMVRDREAETAFHHCEAPRSPASATQLDPSGLSDAGEAPSKTR
ncbi:MULTISPECIES: hypothetical protein [Streptomyces]|nr:MULTISPECIES: hypothetical protein [Streptomyces]